MRKKTIWGVRRLVCKTIADVLGMKTKEVLSEHTFARDLQASDTDVAEILTYLDIKLGIIFPERDEGTRKTRTVASLTKRVLACYRRTHGSFACGQGKKRRELTHGTMNTG